MTSRRAARCCFACGSALGRPPGSQPLPVFMGLAPSASRTAGLSPGPAHARLPPNRVGVPLSSVFALPLLRRDGLASLGLLRDKVPSGAGCCSVQGAPSSSPTLPPLQAQLRADHGNAPEVSACSSVGSSALPSPPDGGAVDSHCFACPVSPSAMSSC